MDKFTNHSQKAQGALSEEVEEAISSLTIEQVEKWLTDDLGRARSLLQAIHDDKNIMRLVAIHLHGLAVNYQNGKESLKQASNPRS